MYNLVVQRRGAKVSPSPSPSPSSPLTSPLFLPHTLTPPPPSQASQEEITFIAHPTALQAGEGPEGAARPKDDAIVIKSYASGVRPIFCCS